jgi:hypothetical protein
MNFISLIAIPFLIGIAILIIEYFIVQPLKSRPGKNRSNSDSLNRKKPVRNQGSSLLWEGRSINIMSYVPIPNFSIVRTIVNIDGKEVAVCEGNSLHEMAIGSFVHNNQTCQLRVDASRMLWHFGINYIIQINNEIIGRGKLRHENEDALIAISCLLGGMTGLALLFILISISSK